MTKLVSTKDRLRKLPFVMFRHTCPLAFADIWRPQVVPSTDQSDNLTILLMTHDDKLDNTHTQDNDLTPT